MSSVLLFNLVSWWRSLHQGAAACDNWSFSRMSGFWAVSAGTDRDDHSGPPSGGVSGTAGPDNSELLDQQDAPVEETQGLNAAQLHALRYETFDHQWPRWSIPDAQAPDSPILRLLKPLLLHLHGKGWGDALKYAEDHWDAFPALAQETGTTDPNDAITSPLILLNDHLSHAADLRFNLRHHGARSKKETTP